MTMHQQRIDQVGRFLQIDPHNRHLLADMVELQRAAGAPDEAARWLERALGQHPDDPRLRHLLATEAMAEGRYREAREVLLTLQDLVGREAAVAWELGWLDCAEGNYAGARAWLERHPGIEHEIPEAGILLARCMHHLGEPQAALARIEQMLERRPDDAAALGLGALLAFDLMQLDKAGAWSEAALAREPDNADALVVAAGLALEAGDRQRCGALYDHALAVNQDLGRAWLGKALLDLGALRLAQARQHFERALQLMPDHLGTRVALGWCILLGGDIDAAQALFEQALALNRNFAETHGALAVIHVMRNERAQAERAASRALRLDRQCVSGLHVRALLDGTVTDIGSLQRFSTATLATLQAAATVKNQPGESHD